MLAADHHNATSRVRFRLIDVEAESSLSFWAIIAHPTSDGLSHEAKNRKHVQRE